MLLLQLAQRLQLRSYLFVHFHTLGHDQPLARLLAPTRQHEGMDVKRLGDLLHADAGKLAQAYGRSLEVLAVLVGRSRPGTRHLNSPDR